MDTGTSSKMSNSRPEKERGPNRKQRKMKRAQEHYNKMGLEWKEPEQLRLDAAALALPGVADLALASSMHNHILEQKQNEPKPEGDEKIKAIEDALVKEIPEDMHRWVQKKDGNPFCFLCKKVATEGHLRSNEHMRRMEEDVLR